MERLNYLEVEANRKIKSISVIHGDILHLEDPIDILFVSIFCGGLSPIPGTLLGHLFESGIDVRKLNKNMALDFRNGLNTWLSIPLSGYAFKRILFFEMQGIFGGIKDGASMEEIFENLFLTLMIIEKKGIPVGRVAMPLLGTGNQKLKQEQVIPILLSTIKRFLDEIESLENVFIIEKNLLKATSLSEETNKYLRRADLRLNIVSFRRNTRKSILNNIKKIQNHNFPDSNIFNELINAMNDNESRSYQVGILGRRLLEFILNDLVPGTGFSVYQRIQLSKEKGIAEWIISYMHLIRIFGNESAHQQSESLRIPSLPDEEDLMMNLVAINRILEFWLSYRENSIFKFNINEEIEIQEEHLI